MEVVIHIQAAGDIQFGVVDIIWSDGVNGAVIRFPIGEEPGGDWTSAPQVIESAAGRTVGATLAGVFSVNGESCAVPSPGIAITVN